MHAHISLRYSGIGALGVRANSTSTYLSFDRPWPSSGGLRKRGAKFKTHTQTTHRHIKDNSICLTSLAGQLSQGQAPSVPWPSGTTSMQFSREQPFYHGDDLNFSPQRLLQFLPQRLLVCPRHCPAQNVHVY